MTYADKSERTGIRVLDLMNPDELREQLEWTINYKNVILEKLYNLPPLDPQEVIEQYLGMQNVCALTLLIHR